MTVEKAKEWLKLNDLPDIAVKKRGGRDTIFSYSVETGQGKIEETIDFFEKNIALVPPGRYVLIAKLGAKSGASQRVFDFDIQEDHAAGINGTGDSIGQLVAAQVKSEVSAFRAEMEKERLQTRIKELEQELRQKNSWQPKLEFLSEKLIEGFMKLNGNFQKSLTNSTPAADANMNGGGSGAGENNGVSGVDQEVAEDLDQRANAAFDVLIEKVGADIVPALEALAQKDAGTLRNLLGYLQ